MRIATLRRLKALGVRLVAEDEEMLYEADNPAWCDVCKVWIRVCGEEEHRHATEG